jgi:cysteine desulfurase/selenocysteine lyase
MGKWMKTTDYRRDFPLLMQETAAYLDNAATAQRPQCVLDAEKTFYETQNANPLRGLYPLSIAATEAVEEARVAVRDFLHAKSSQEIIFTRNTTEALNLVAYSYGLSHVHAGDEVVVSILEHHSNLLPWQMVCRQTGATLKFIDCEMDGRLDLNKVSGIITEKTKIVAVTHVSNVIGRVNPIREIADMAHRVGAVIVVDGAQSTPHIPVDVQALDADFLAFSGHKVFGPMGIGALYGKRRLLEKMPPFLSGGEMIESVTRTGATYAELPYKFEAGTGNAAGAVGLHAAIRYMQSVGFDTMHERETALVAHMMAGMADMPFIHVLGSGSPEEHSGIVTFTVDGVHPHDVSEILAADGVCIRAGHHCAQPLLKHLGYSSTVRASCAFYNTPDEVDRLLDSLKTIRERMGYGKQELL